MTFDARTDITTRMLSDEGYAVAIPAAEEGQEQELVFGKRAYERKFFSDETNLRFVRCFLDNAKCDPITGEVGKTILFAVSRRHATKLVTLLNEEATRRWPNEYGSGSTFAVQVTSDIPGAQQMTLDFANNNLNGKSKWRADEFRDYDTSRTRVCVTVGMMTTGYDCEDVLNVALARPMFSPTDFIQVKGRGTRLFTFKHGDGADQRVAIKDGFALFDFFANCAYFEDEFDYDKKLTLPRSSTGEDDGDAGDGGGGRVESYTNTSLDPLATVVREQIGPAGMRIDREMYRERFERQALDAVAADAALKDAIESENWAAIEANIRRLLFEKPDEFWNLPKLQNLFKTDRLPTLREIIARVLGFATGISTRSQLANEEFERFLATQTISPIHVREMRTVFTAFLLDPDCRAMLTEARFAELRARDANLYGSLSHLSAQVRDELLGYLKSHVSLSQFELAA